MKTFVTVTLIGAMGLPLLTQDRLKHPENPMSHKEVSPFKQYVTEAMTFDETVTLPDFDILKLVPEYVQTPEGGVPWEVFGETKEIEYNYTDAENFEWTGVKPEFSENLKKLDRKTILIQGYMFPLSQDEKQATFLFGPFPVSCPYHYHIPPRLVIEVSSKTPLEFTYDAINIKGMLELVPDDKEFNVFYRLKNVEAVPL